MIVLLQAARFEETGYAVSALQAEAPDEGLP